MLELSLREALHLGHSYIGTEHILLGLVREGEGVAIQVLISLGADPGRVGTLWEPWLPATLILVLHSLRFARGESGA